VLPNAKRNDEYTPREAAECLGVHTRTVIDWCRRAVEGRPSRLFAVRHSHTGRYYVKRAEVDALLDSGSQAG